MAFIERITKVAALFGAFGVAFYLAVNLRGGSGLWEGLTPAANAASNASVQQANTAGTYDLTQLRVVNEVLKTIRDRYADPKRVRPKEMLLAALNRVQKGVAQVIVSHDEGSPVVKVRVDTQEKEFHIDNVQGPWDVSARLRDIFAFLQDGLRGTEVDLREIEYDACNGMLRTLDPHSELYSPEGFREMNILTTGQFGGLGIVISIRDQQLTVMNPMPGTPAGRAGVKKYDRIVRINNEPTLNMGLNEAVNHLRGNPGSKVTVYLHREGPEGWPGVKAFELVRETIHVASVEHRLMEGNIGYVRLKAFQPNTSADLEAALADMKKSGELKGLVLDLRGNGGGLLDQAAKVVDKFVSEGPIVATVGNSEGRDEKVAHAEGTEPDYPIALLVNGSSASASEIVAGALKNHDRAVLIGETTFGKGSVQLIFQDLPDKAALKVTIAQYLTEPGDVSIQGVGVTPDIALDPMTVDPLEMDLTVDTGGLKERDLARSLSNSRAREGAKPEETVRYDLPEKERRDLRERSGDPDDAFAIDFPMKFAHDFVGHVSAGKRLDQVRQAKAFITEARTAELAKVASDLKTIAGVDWTDAPANVAAASPPTVMPNIDVKVETDRPDNEVTAGDPMTLKLTVTNRGTQPLFRLSAVSKSDDYMFDNRELIFGRLDPGKTRTATAPLGYCEIEGRRLNSIAPIAKDAPRICHVPKEALTRADGIKLHFEEARGHVPADTEARVTVKALERPTFAYTYDIVDNRDGANGDGRVQRGEGFTMYLAVKNVGKGRSYETNASIRNLSGEGLVLHEGRFDISNMMPGETKHMAFTFDVQHDLADPEAKVELAIGDDDLREAVVEKVRMPVAPVAPLTQANVTVRAKASGASLLASPDASAVPFGKLSAGTSAQEVATSGDMVKLALGNNRFGFVRASEVEAGGTPAQVVAFEDTMAHAPPQLDLGQIALATRDTHAMIKGTAGDSERLLDAYMFVGSRKFFYRSNRNGADPLHMGFEADAPLRPGVNVVTVVARENPDTTSHKTFIIRRDGPNGELLQSPKTEEDDVALGGDDDSDY